jgi:heat shock protein HslJ
LTTNQLQFNLFNTKSILILKFIIKMKKLIGLFILIAAFISCKKEAFEIAQNTVSHNDIIGKWEMIRYQDLDANDDRLKPDAAFALGSMIVEFKADSTIAGRENCNTISGIFLISNQKIKISGIGRTKINCNLSWVQLFYNVFDAQEMCFINKSGDIITLISQNKFKKATLKKI